MTNLYPIKFNPIIKERVWGGDRLVKYFEKDYGAGKAVGESWELSSVKDDISVAVNGFLKGNTLVEILETYMSEISGDKLYEKFGNEFPILIKLLDINEKLSVQVHPDDKTAMERHNSYGKAECWYVMDAEKEATIYLGFSKDISREELLERCKSETLHEVMNVIHPKKGDFLYLEPGTIHAASGGILIAEIQQTSDVTYRIYDWGRENNPETKREMHLDLALDIINYKQLQLSEKVYRKSVAESISDTINLTDNSYFKVDEINITGRVVKHNLTMNGFVVYVAISGDTLISYENGAEVIEAGETILIPAALENYSMEKLNGECRLLEVTGKF